MNKIVYYEPMTFPDTLAEILRNGGCAVIPTDTIYGVVASAWKETGVERVYALKGRSLEKPCIILLDSLERMRDFGVSDEDMRKVASFATEAPTSFIVPITCNDLSYLDRGTQTLAFRIPHEKELCNFLSRTGPLIAPSANPEGLPPATTIDKARAYFGDTVDHYVDGGTIEGTPSALIDIRTGTKLR
jgi:L-threonylcarbamoyladenylate synthase